MKRPKRWSRHNLPQDLWPEILSFLPVKTLLQFRSVSKLWRALIDDPDFARLHLHRFHENRCETHLLVRLGSLWRNYVKVGCTQSLRLTGRLHFPNFYKEVELHWDALSSIDGLFMLTGHRYDSTMLKTPELMVWNLATRKTLILPPSPQISTERVKAIDLGLGFDPLDKDYKHVRLFLVRASGAVDSVAVYSLATKSWKMIRYDQGNNLHSRKDLLNVRRLSVLCLRGVLFCLAAEPKMTPGCVELVSFDFRRETIAYKRLPVEDKEDLSLEMAEDGCSLAFVSFSSLEGSGSVWVLEGLGAHDITSLTWSKRYTIASTIPSKGGGFFYLMKNGELLLKWNRMMMSYNLKTGKEKIVRKKGFYGDAWPYKESLVLLN